MGCFNKIAFDYFKYIRNIFLRIPINYRKQNSLRIKSGQFQPVVNNISLTHNTISSGI
jgi:hypothetical protein